MIIGNGIDIIDITRIEKIIKRFGQRFINRCFTNNEISKSKILKNKISFYAKRFAAKEACSKALGIGFTNGLIWKDIEIVNNKLGKPEILLHNNALKRLNVMTKKISKITVSISDEKKYAIANVIIFEI